MSNEEAKALGKTLWAIANALRGSIDADQFRDYMLGFIFFKYLSENYESYVNNEILKHDKMTIKEYYEKYEDDEERIEALKEEVKSLGYYLDYKDLWSSFASKAIKNNDIINDLKKAFKNIESSTVGIESDDEIGGLFHELDLDSIKLGKNYEERNKKICSIIKTLDENLTTHSVSTDDLGNAYEYLIGEFAASSGKKAGEFYTPQKVSSILSKIVVLDNQDPKVGKKSKLKSVYDPTCGSGSLLFNVYQEAGCNISMIYGQESNLTTFNLARMNLILHRVGYNKFKLAHGNTLMNPAVGSKDKFEAIVANPPFSSKAWEPDNLIHDNRFMGYGLPPKDKADYAFILHMVYHLADNGTCAVVVPHGVLFRGGTEGKIRENLLKAGEGKTGFIDAVIGLPSNLFYSTGIPVCILVLKKCRKYDDILFIDASKYFEKEKKQNILTNEHVEKIVNTYKNRECIEKYSRRVKLDEIKENDYNLNIARYIDTSEEEVILDTNEIVENIKEIDKKLIENKKTIDSYAKELGIAMW